MDTTSSTIGGTDNEYIFNSTYVSCIKVDGQPILPPLMTEKRREEMRRYREQAIIREKELQERKINQTFHVPISTGSSTSSFAKHLTAKCAVNPVDLPELKGSRSPSSSPPLRVPATSTPRVRRTYSVVNETSTIKQSTEEMASPDVPEGVLRERKITVQPLDFNKSISSVPSADGSSALSYDGDEEKGDADRSESDDQRSEDNFASAASSTGTFVIRRSSENKSAEENSKKTEAEKYATSSSEEEEDKTRRNPPSTVVRKTNIEDEGTFTRKRPAKYFDIEDEETDKSKCSTFSNIPNYVVAENHSEKHNSLVADASGSSCRFSPVPITNFTSVAKSLTIDFTKKFCTTDESSSTGNKIEIEKPKRGSGGGSYDVRLSKDVPSSAEKVKDFDVVAISNSSDKENIDVSSSSSNHVRKLSYTLTTPSAVLLEAVSKSKDKLLHVQSLETVPSAPSSVGVQSPYQNPEKSNIKELQRNQRGRINKELTMTGLNLGHGKQAHLERFFGDQESLSKTVTTSDESVHSVQDAYEMQQLLKKIQEEHEIQLRRLAEQHRLQERRIQEDFESELEKIKEKFSSIFSPTSSAKSITKVSPSSVVDSVNNSAQSVLQTNTTVSESRSIILPMSTLEELTATTTNSEKLEEQSSSMSEQRNKSKNMSVFHFTGGNSTIGDMPSSANLTSVHSGGGPMELSGVGLSKLQSRMHLMSPRMFRTPADARSPLLKGLVFLDPLEKPVAPLRIPKMALEPHTKPKFDRISAAVKGFLTRRLLNTEKVQIIVQTIRDTVDLLLKLYEEAPPSGDATSVKPQDNDLHHRIIQQLTGACRSFHDVFFKLSTKERMAIIATDREKLKTKALRSISSPAKPNISNATLKSIERRMSHASSPKRDYKKSRSSRIYDPYHGSQSVKPKAIKTFNISPKRRRISYWDDKNTTVSRSTPSLVGIGKQDLNGNNFKTTSSRTQTSSRVAYGSVKTFKLSGAAGMGETFIVPSAVLPSRNGLGSSLSGRRDSSTPSYAKSISARSTQSSISVASSSSGINKSRSSTSRQPWK